MVVRVILLVTVYGFVATTIGKTNKERKTNVTVPVTRAYDEMEPIPSPGNSVPVTGADDKMEPIPSPGNSVPVTGAYDEMEPIPSPGNSVPVTGADDKMEPIPSPGNLVPVTGADDKIEPIPSPDCYHGDGSSYRGTHNTTKSGKACLPWPVEVEFYFEDQGMEGGHNYCRNPFERNMPSCATNIAKEKVEECDMLQCSSARSMILLQSAWFVTIVLVVFLRLTQTSDAVL